MVAVDYADTLIDMDAMARDSKDPLTVTPVQAPSGLYTEELKSYNETDFLWFQIELSDKMINSQGKISIELEEYHKRRREPFPQ